MTVSTNDESPNIGDAVDKAIEEFHLSFLKGQEPNATRLVQLLDQEAEQDRANRMDMESFIDFTNQLVDAAEQRRERLNEIEKQETSSERLRALQDELKEDLLADYKQYLDLLARVT